MTPPSSAAVKRPAAGVSPLLRLLVDVITPLATFAIILWLALVGMAAQVETGQSDFRRFHHSAAAHLAGASMYDSLAYRVEAGELAEGPAMWNLNPPHFHLLVLPLAWLSPQQAHAVWQVVGLTCLVWSLWLTRRAAGGDWTWWLQVGVLLVVLRSPVCHFQILTGQVGWLLMLPTTLMWLAAREGRWRTAGAWLGLLAGLKSFYLILVPYLLLRRRWDALGAAALSLAASFALGLAVFGLDNHRHWLACLGQASGWSWWPGNCSLMGLLARTLGENQLYAPLLSLTPTGVKLVWLVVGGALGLLSLAACAWDGSEERTDRAFALLLTAALLLSPLGWGYYFWLPLGPVLVVLARWARHQSLGVRWWLVIFALPLLFVPYTVSQALQPSPAATLLLGNLFFWPVFALWFALVLDGLAHRRAPRGFLF
jgi:alpha-1,2-mannosyltransferase